MDPAAGSDFKDPSQLSFQSSRTRRAVLGAYWIVILLALPFWWHITSIERLSLPSGRVRAQVQKEPRFPIEIVRDASSFGDVSLAPEVERLLERSSRLDSRRWKGLDVKVRTGAAGACARSH